MKTLQDYLNEINTKKYIIGPSHGWIGTKKFAVENIDVTKDYAWGFECGFTNGGEWAIEECKNKFAEHIEKAHKSRKMQTLRTEIEGAAWRKGCLDGMKAKKEQEAEEEAEAPANNEPIYATPKYYDYETAVKEDIIQHVVEIYLEEDDETAAEFIERNATRRGRKQLHEELLPEVYDYVCGGVDGSYTFNHYTAEEYLHGNTELLYEAAQAFPDYTWETAERADVLIRMYLADDLLADVLDDLAREYNGYAIA